MTRWFHAVPPGYERFLAGASEVVALVAEAAAVRDALRSGSLLEYAEYEARTGHSPVATHRGRGLVYAVPLPRTGTRVVVRRARRGGLIRRLTPDRFVKTRAWRELGAALRLTASGVPTPEVVAFALHQRGLVWLVSDIATRELPAGRDLAAVLATGDARASARALTATARLLAALARAGARHRDLNARNVYVFDDAGADPVGAAVLDVDRVRFFPGGCPHTARANARRLARSLAALRVRAGLPVRDEHLRSVRAMATCP